MNMIARLIFSICLLALVLLFAFSNSPLCISLIPVLITIIPILYYLLNRKPVNDFLKGYNPGKMADNDYHYALVQLFKFIYHLDGSQYLRHIHCERYGSPALERRVSVKQFRQRAYAV